MKIVFASSSFGGGGMTTFGVELIRELSRNNSLSVILGSDDVAPIDKTRADVYYYDCKDLRVQNVKTVLSLINDTLKPDLVISSGATIIPVISPYLDDEVRVITISHSAKFFHSEYSALNNKYLDRIIAASSTYNKHYLEKKYHIKDSSKVKVVYNFVSDIDGAKDLIKEKKNTNCIQIIFPGSCAAPKTPELALKIVKELIKTDWNFKFYWTGDTTIPLSKYFSFIGLHKIEQLVGKDDRVVFTGRIPLKKDLDDIVAHSNIILAPSRREGCSMALIEALRAGDIAIVSTYPNSNRELTEDNKNGFIIPYDRIDLFVDKIGEIINSNREFQRFYDNSRCVFNEKLTKEVWSNQIQKEMLHCEIKHKKRRKSLLLIGLRLNIIKMKRLSLTCRLRAFWSESLPLYISLLITYIKQEFKYGNVAR